jgi:ParB-like chromosome segregation protein Spo0J
MIQVIPISKLESNTGQIKGLPQNPRFIKDERFKALVKSLKDDPEMLEQELLVFPHGSKFVIIGGNMRYRAGIEIGLTELPCKVLPQIHLLINLELIQLRTMCLLGKMILTFLQTNGTT